jgi:predicted metal-dependent peptidase
MTSSIATPTGDLVEATQDLRYYVEEMLNKDKRFEGMSRYILNLNFYWSSAIKTACAGHGFIFFNFEYWSKLLEEQKKTVIAHEIWHIMLKHLERGEGYDQRIANQAFDHVINLGLKADGFMMDQGMDFGHIKPCCDPRFTNMGFMEIYRILKQEIKDDPSSHPGNPSEPSREQIEDLIKEAIKDQNIDLLQVKQENDKAVDKALKAGSQTGNSDRLLQHAGRQVEIKEASYDEIFEKYLIDPLSGGKRTHLRPSRRQPKSGLRLKGKFPKRGRKNRLTRLVYALDVSGSITRDQANQFIASANTLKQKLNPSEMIIILWDTQIKFEKIFREDEPIKNIRVRAGGGTDLTEVYERVEQLNPEALVIFTDLFVSIPPKPSWETIWFVPDLPYIQTNHVTYGDVYLIPETK